MKTCLRCHRTLPLIDFALTGRGQSYHCDQCVEQGLTEADRRRAKRMATWAHRQRNLDRIRAYDREYQRRRAA